LIGGAERRRMLRRIGGRVDVLDLAKFVVKLCLTIVIASTLLFFVSYSMDIDFGSRLRLLKIAKSETLSFRYNIYNERIMNFNHINNITNSIIDDDHHLLTTTTTTTKTTTTNTNDDDQRCYKNVPKHNGRCGYFANIVDSMKSGKYTQTYISHIYPTSHYILSLP